MPINSVWIRKLKQARTTKPMSILFFVLLGIIVACSLTFGCALFWRSLDLANSINDGTPASTLHKVLTSAGIGCGATQFAGAPKGKVVILVGPPVKTPLPETATPK